MIGISDAGVKAASKDSPAGEPSDTAIVTAAEHPEQSDAAAELCELIEMSAEKHGVPAGFFTRLLWKESHFRSDAISPKGAQGIAQFMPATAEERGLLDPFDVAAAVPASASYLADLKARFGNIGLAAAAYNAGPARVTDWIAEASTLPWETQDFVVSITGIEADVWADPEALESASGAPEEDCKILVARLKLPGEDLGPAIATERAPWGVQVAGNFSRARAMRAYARIQGDFEEAMGGRLPMIVGQRMRSRGTRIFYHARVPMQTREEANELCDRIRATGGSCVVLKT